ncbi:Hypothetical protein D9617_48g089520 [Elsinoe fawcettii]|nr:Hypothetical protein D9617_48g089520 [Elsinoe fawcettii]
MATGTAVLAKLDQIFELQTQLKNARTTSERIELLQTHEDRYVQQTITAEKEVERIRVHREALSHIARKLRLSRHLQQPLMEDECDKLYQNNESRVLSCLVAIGIEWSWELVQYYQWSNTSYLFLRQLRQIALGTKWEHFLKVINRIMIERHTQSTKGDRNAVSIGEKSRNQHFHNPACPILVADLQKYNTANRVAKVKPMKAEIRNWLSVGYLEKRGFSGDIIKHIVLHIDEYGLLQRGPSPKSSTALRARKRGLASARSERNMPGTGYGNAVMNGREPGAKGREQEQQARKKSKKVQRPKEGEKRKKLPNDEEGKQEKTRRGKRQGDSEVRQTQYSADPRKERPTGKRQRVMSHEDGRQYTNRRNGDHGQSLAALLPTNLRARTFPNAPPDIADGDDDGQTREDTVQEECPPTVVFGIGQADQQDENAGQDVHVASEINNTAGGADGAIEGLAITARRANAAAGTTNVAAGRIPATRANVASLGRRPQSQTSTGYSTPKCGDDIEVSNGVTTPTGHDPPEYDIGFGHRIETRYLTRIASLRKYLLQDLTTRNSELTQTQLAWLEKGEIVPRVNGLGSSTADDVCNNGIRLLSIDAYRQAVKNGHCLPPYFIVRQSFADADEWQDQHKMADFAQMIRTTYTGRMFSVKEAGSQHASEMDAEQFADLLENPKHGYNALDLGDLVRGDEPLFTRWLELTLLRSLIDSRTGGSKSEKGEYHDVLSCLGFNLVGTYASFSGAHVDALSGTWVRVLSGTKLWFIPNDMSESDWEAFRNLGPAWIPSKTCKIVILERNDVLVMRPGQRTVHAAMSLDLCVLQGGMFWDYDEVEGTLEDLIWLANNPITTNEELALQLPDVIERLISRLEKWPDLFTARMDETRREGHNGSLALDDDDDDDDDDPLLSQRFLQIIGCEDEDDLSTRLDIAADLRHVLQSTMNAISDQDLVLILLSEPSTIHDQQDVARLLEPFDVRFRQSNQNIARLGNWINDCFEIYEGEAFEESITSRKFDDQQLSNMDWSAIIGKFYEWLRPDLQNILCLVCAFEDAIPECIFESAFATQHRWTQQGYWDPVNRPGICEELGSAAGWRDRLYGLEPLLVVQHRGTGQERYRIDYESQRSIWAVSGEKQADWIRRARNLILYVFPKVTTWSMRYVAMMNV